MPPSAKEKIIVALDVPSLAEARSILTALEGAASWCKIGLQLFTREGPPVVAMARARGFRVFLDLKFHDIPNTVASAARSAAGLGVEMLTVHLAGGPEMIRGAVEAAPGVCVLGVTVLTSSTASTLAAVGIAQTPADWVPQLAGVGAACAVGGIVCSPLEIAAVRAAVGPAVKIVTPGVRPAGADHGDQQRVLTPSAALAAGADFLVIGRPILAAPDRRAAFEAIAATIAPG
ncbi:MAG: orotidine-5'-phosphate decarboxylase [Terrimicrobiaceae bacterium]|nr:orotidine-5'-phosphate decarboxylase [Terrimicrobiaceae bacterium]